MRLAVFKGRDVRQKSRGQARSARPRWWMDAGREETFLATAITLDSTLSKLGNLEGWKRTVR